MSVKKCYPRVPGHTLETDRLEKVVVAATPANARIIRQVSREMQYTATQSVLEARRLDKRTCEPKTLQDSISCPSCP